MGTGKYCHCSLATSALSYSIIAVSINGVTTTTSWPAFDNAAAFLTSLGVLDGWDGATIKIRAIFNLGFSVT
jgi:hypothetical protein